MRVLVPSALMAVAASFAQPFGTWIMNPARSTFSGGVQPKSLVVRLEPHPKGEVFTLDRTEPDGRSTSSSSILYLDGIARDFQDFGCSGSQSSRRIDGMTVEILRQCGAGAWTKFVRRASAKPQELVLEVTEHHADGHHFERRLVFEKQ